MRASPRPVMAPLGKLLPLIGVTIAASMLIPAAALASCAGPVPVPQAIDDAPAVFVGTVTKLTNSERWATVEVEEVWKGEDVPSEVELRAGSKDPPGGGGIASSVDRFYSKGARYIFFPFKRSDAIFRDNVCTRTTKLPNRIERFRPTAVSDPSPDADPEPLPEDPGRSPEDEGLAADETDGSGGVSGWVVLGIAIAALGGSLALWRFRSRRFSG